MAARSHWRSSLGLFLGRPPGPVFFPVLTKCSTFVSVLMSGLAPGHEPQGFQNSHPGWEVQCHIHLQRLESYTALRVDARPDQVQQLLQLAQAQGAPSHDGLVAVKQARFSQKQFKHSVSCWLLVFPPGGLQEARGRRAAWATFLPARLCIFLDATGT